MKKLILFAAVIAVSFSTRASNPVYLSPTGNDSASGAKQAPVNSLSRALEIVRNSTSKDTAYVKIAKGRYYMDSPFTITEKDSCLIVFEAEEGAEFLGAVPIKGWRPWKNGIWRTYIPEVARYGFSFEQLWVNNKRAVVARTPNTDWYYVKKSNETAIDTLSNIPEYAVQQIDVLPENITELKNMTHEERRKVKILFYHKWDITQKYIDYADVDSGRFYISGEGMKPWNQITGGSRYVMSNYMAALDTPNEWFLSPDGWLYYMPDNDTDMTAVESFAPVVDQFIKITGSEDTPVKDKIFKNIKFKYSGFKMPLKGNEPMQAAAFTPAAVMVDIAENIQFINCAVEHTGAYGIWLRRECKNNVIEHCLISDLGAGGIKIGETSIREGREITQGNTIHNNIIQHAGYVFPCGVGVAMFHTSDNNVTHNEISDLRYSGVSIGWIWGYKESGITTTIIDRNGKSSSQFLHISSPAVRNVVEYNNIHHIGWGELSDMGAVYTLGESPGTRVSNNIIHDILSYDYGGWGLYTDEGSTGVVMENNLVYRCKSGGFHQHYGKENIIRNNIFAFGHYYQLQFTRVEPHLSFSFTNNIVVQGNGINLAGAWQQANINMDYNCYYDIRGFETKFGELPLKEWQKIKDKHSIVADPMFNDIMNDDYSFKSTKTAKRIGFKPFDYSKAGVYGSSEWQEQAKLSPEIVSKFNEIAKIRTKQ